jgi:preprotein translocase subunit YajC
MDMKEEFSLKNDTITTIVMLIFFVAFFYMTIVMPQRKKEKQVQQMTESLKVGDEIVTIGGILGKIININDDVVTIEASAEKTKINIKRRAVSEVTNSKTQS